MAKVFMVLVILLLVAAGGLYLVSQFAVSNDDRVSPRSPTNLICTADAKVCDDGSSVGRDGRNNCEFYPCPVTQPVSDEPMACTLDAKICADGTGVGRDGTKGCTFAPCPGEGRVSGTVTLTGTCQYETVFDKPCPTSAYEGDLRLEPVAGGVVTLTEVTGGRFYATLPAGTYEISSGRALPRCDARFTVTDGVESTFGAICEAGYR